MRTITASIMITLVAGCGSADRPDMDPAIGKSDPIVVVSPIVRPPSVASLDADEGATSGSMAQKSTFSQELLDRQRAAKAKWGARSARPSEPEKTPASSNAKSGER